MREGLSYAAANGMWLASFLPSHLAFRRAVKNPEQTQAAARCRLERAWF